MSHRFLSTMSASASLCVLCVGGATLAQDAAPAERPQRTIFAFETRDLGALLVDPRDQALRRALEMLPARLAELPDEVPDLDHIPPCAFELAARALVNGVSLGVTDRGNDPATGAPGLGLALAVGVPDAETARATHKELAALLRDLGGLNLSPSSVFPGMDDVQTPAGTIRVGPRQSQAGGWTLGALIGDLPDADAAARSLPDSGGLGDPWLRMRLDLPAAQQWTSFFAGMASIQAPQVGKMLQDRGLVGPEAISVETVAAQGTDALRARTVVHRARKYAGALGVSDERLTPETLSIVPADAMFAAVQMFDLAGLWEQLESAAKATPEGAESLARFAELTGLDIRTDIVDAFGNVGALYTSDSTGGGGLFSAVALVEVEHRERLAAQLSKLAAFVNEQISAELPTGYARLVHTSVDGVDRMTLTFPGLPIPMESTIALTDRWLIAGFTPQAVEGAIAQCAGKGAGSLLENASFRAVMPQAPQELTQLMFIDSPRAMAKGYPWVSALTSGVANLVRSPGGAEREPGNLLPPFAELARHARPMIATARWEGDNLVQEWSADRSLLVNACAAAGIYGEVVTFLTPVIAGVAAPAIAEGQAATKSTQEMIRFHALANAWHLHAIQNEEHPPLSLSVLVDSGLLPPEMTESAFGDASDGGPDFWLRKPGPNFVTLSGIRAPDRTIVAYSRAQASAGGGVTVAFADGSVEAMTLLEFFSAMGDEANEGVDFELPMPAPPEWPQNRGGRRPNFQIAPERPQRQAM